jgi:hypothetical protein
MLAPTARTNVSRDFRQTRIPIVRGRKRCALTAWVDLAPAGQMRGKRLVEDVEHQKSRINFRL